MDLFEKQVQTRVPVSVLLISEIRTSWLLPSQHPVPEFHPQQNWLDSEFPHND